MMTWMHLRRVTEGSKNLYIIVLKRLMALRIYKSARYRCTYASISWPPTVLAYLSAITILLCITDYYSAEPDYRP